MDFGKVKITDLSNIKFDLPTDGVLTKQVLVGNGAAGNNCRFFIGGAKWGKQEWVGMLYPKGTKSNNFLSEYAKQFNSIEMNAMYHALPSVKTIESWKAVVGSDFKFCPKFTKQITHEKMLKNCMSELSAFISTLHTFGSNLGSVFLPLHPLMGVKEEQVILDFIELLPNDVNLFLELRSENWFEGGAYYPIFEFLKNRGMGVVITDTAGRRDCVHMELTNKRAFIRFVGNNLHESDYARIDNWVERIGIWIQGGLEELYFYMHQNDERNTPILLDYFIRKLNRSYNLGINPPRLYNEQESKLTLF